MKFIKIAIGFCSFFFLSWTTPQSADPRTLITQIFTSVSSKVKNRYEMETIGTKIAMPGGNVKSLGLCFLLQRPIDLHEARDLILFASESLLNEINSCDELKPYLVDQPWNIENVVITIQITEKNGKIIPYPNISFVSLVNGNISYEGYDYDAIKHIIEIHTETYEESKQKNN